MRLLAFQRKFSFSQSEAQPIASMSLRGMCAQEGCKAQARAFRAQLVSCQVSLSLSFLQQLLLCRKLVLVLAWTLMAALFYRILFKVEVATFEWDPYAILDLDKDAKIDEIEQRYRKLLKTEHPGRGGDADKFAQIAKAYRVLTNRKAKANYMMFGDPDGPGGELFGIA